MNLGFQFDENLKEVPNSISDIKLHIENLNSKSQNCSSLIEKVKCLSEAGAYLRIIRDLDLAENYLQKALKLIIDENLDFQLHFSTSIRLAHVHQWKKEFSISNDQFDRLLESCSSEKLDNLQLAFLHQHRGKNFFDQERYLEALSEFELALKLRQSSNCPQDQIDSTIQSMKRTKELI